MISPLNENAMEDTLCIKLISYTTLSKTNLIFEIIKFCWIIISFNIQFLKLQKTNSIK